MYNKKYIADKIEELGKYNPLHEEVDGKVCYLAYLNAGERGWILYETNDWFNPVHRLHTSVIEDVEYTDNQVIIRTQNTRYTFKLI